MGFAAQIEVSAGDGRGGDEGLVGERVGGQDFIGFAHADDDDVAFFGGEIEFAVDGDGRGLEVVGLGQADALVEGLAGGGVEVGEEARVGDEVEFAIVEDREAV